RPGGAEEHRELRTGEDGEAHRLVQRDDVRLQRRLEQADALQRPSVRDQGRPIEGGGDERGRGDSGVSEGGGAGGEDRDGHSDVWARLDGGEGEGRAVPEAGGRPAEGDVGGGPVRLQGPGGEPRPEDETPLARRGEGAVAARREDGADD